MLDVEINKKSPISKKENAWCKKQIGHLYKLLENKHNIHIDVDTPGIRRCEFFLDKNKDNIDTIIKFIDHELQHVFDPLQYIPRNHTDSYQRKYEQIIKKEEKYNTVKQRLIDYKIHRETQSS